MPNWFVIRADANEKVGIGHVMRCLALAEWLSDYQYKPVLITKHFNSFIETKVIELKGKVIIIPESTDLCDEKYSHSNWLKGSEENDALQCLKVIEQEKSINGELSPSFIMVDHYALAAPWETKISVHGPILVVDDLSDRQHKCKWLIDQTLGKIKSDYSSLVLDDTKLMMGPKYALIRKEFAEKARLLKRGLPDAEIRVLLTLGGVDRNNYTSKLVSFIEASKAITKKKIVTTVVTSHLNPNLNDLKKTVGCLNQISLLIDVHNMAELMATNDVCIGAAGSTSWERCVMSLPTLSIVLAENQKTISKNLSEAGAIINLDLMRNITKNYFLEMFNSLINNIELYESVGKNCNSLCDGLGCQRVIREVMN